MDLARELQPVFIDVGDDHVSGAGMTRNCRGHDSDRAGAGNQHVLAKNFKRQRGMNGISERIEYRSGVAIHSRIVTPDVGHRQRDEFRETSWTIDADSRSVRAQMTAAGQAVAAASAHDVTFTGDELSAMKVVDVGTGFDDLADEFVSDGHRDGNGLPGPFVPVVDVNVGSANARAQHADKDVVDTDGGLRNVFEPQSGLSVRF